MITEAKIGIGIVHCQSKGSTVIGYNKVYTSDYGKWSSIIDDTGNVFNYVKIDHDTILRMIHFSKDGDGWYMCSMKPISGRDEEYRASWVYFPSSLDLSQKDIKAVIEVAESQIKQKEFDTNELQNVIQSYTKIIEDSPLYEVPTEQRGFAFRDTSSGNYNLYDLYAYMYQKEFTKYEWVFLMDKSQLSFKGNSVDDISNRKILESYIIKPATNEFGFIPYLNGVEFRSPVRIMEGESLSIEFKKEGYVDIPKTIKTQSDFSISINDCKKYFKESQFVAKDSKNNKRIIAIIKPLNATEDKIEKRWIFNEAELKTVKLNVMAEGYIADSFELDLHDKSLNDEISLPLEPEDHKYLFVLPLDRSVVKDSASIEVSIHSQFKINGSPFEGYKCSGTPREGGTPNMLTAVKPLPGTSPSNSNGVSHTEYNGKKKKHFEDRDKPTNLPIGPTFDDSEIEEYNPIWKYVKLAVMGIVALALAAIVGYFVYDKFFRLPAPDDVSADGAVIIDDSEGGGLPKDKWDAAYNYLINNDNQIYKKDMEHFDDLKGLFEILNKYDFKTFVESIDKHPHGESILSIKVWKRLYDKAKEIGFNKKGIYDDLEEPSITFDRFIDNDFSKMENEGDIIDGQTNFEGQQ